MGKKNYIVLLFIISLFLSGASVFAYPINSPTGSPQPTAGNQLTNPSFSNSNLNGNYISNLINKVMQGFSTGGAQSIINSSPLPVGSATPASNGAGSGGFSANSIMDGIKAVLSLLLNLFLVVIQVVIDIIRALLGAISGK